MLKLFYSLSLIIASLILLMAEVSLSYPVEPQISTPRQSSQELDVPVCYMRLADGKLVNLEKICGEESISPISNSPWVNCLPGWVPSGANCVPNWIPSRTQDAAAAPAFP
jgi:hypothetical protein